MRKIIIALCALLACANAFGFYIGRTNVPRYDAGSAFIFLLHRMEITDEGFSINANLHKYIYQKELNKVVSVNLPLADIEKSKSVNRYHIEELYSLYDYMDSTTLIASGVGSFISAKKLSTIIKEPPMLKRMWSNSKRMQRYALLTGGASVVLLAGVFGYRLGYSDTMEYGDKDFISALKDPEMWKLASLEWELCEVIDAFTREDEQYFFERIMKRTEVEVQPIEGSGGVVELINRFEHMFYLELAKQGLRNDSEFYAAILDGELIHKDATETHEPQIDKYFEKCVEIEYRRTRGDRFSLFDIVSGQNLFDTRLTWLN